MKIKYRLAALTDLDKICTLVSTAIEEMLRQKINQWDGLYPTREDIKADIENQQLYVGMVKHQIAVIYTINQAFDEEYKNGDWKRKDEPFFVVHRLCVHPAFQNQGIARNALLHIEATLNAMGIHAIRLDVFSQNPHALKLYHHLGYTKTGHADWRKGRFYLMEKYI